MPGTLASNNNNNDNKEVFVYLDDPILCSKVADTHSARLVAVLFKLRGTGLKPKISKCEFLKAKISSLGHAVNGDVIH